MNLSRFTCVSAFILYLVSSEFLSAAEQDNDRTVIRKISPVQSAFLIAIEDTTQQRTHPTDCHFSQEDQIIAELMLERDRALEVVQKEEERIAKQARILELMKQRDEAVKKVQDTKAVSAQQMEEIKTRSNPPVTPQASSVAPQPVKSTASTASSSALYASSSVPRPVSDIAIPEIARGYEDIYRRFLGGKLIYTDPTSKAKKELPIRTLENPLDGNFDLSGCGDTGQYLSISTGYRKGVKPENASKVEIWLAPWFLVNKNLSSSAKHLQPIMGSWDSAAAPVGLFWTWGGWGNADYNYLVSESMDLLGSENLRKKHKNIRYACCNSGRAVPSPFGHTCNVADISPCVIVTDDTATRHQGRWVPVPCPFSHVHKPERMDLFTFHL